MASDPRFDDGKDADALRTIGEVAKALDIKQHVLRYWEQQFPMLKPLKRSGGRRYYRPEDIHVVDRIDQLVNREGYTLKGARLSMQGGSANGQGFDPHIPQNSAPQDTVPQAQANHGAISQGDAAELALRLREMRDRLAASMEK